MALSGLESLYRDGRDVEAEVKFLRGVPGETVEERKALQAHRKEIQETIQKIKAEIEEAKRELRGVNVPESGKKSKVFHLRKTLKDSKQKLKIVKRGRKMRQVPYTVPRERKILSRALL